MPGRPGASSEEIFPVIHSQLRQMGSSVLVNVMYLDTVYLCLADVLGQDSPSYWDRHLHESQSVLAHLIGKRSVAYRYGVPTTTYVPSTQVFHVSTVLITGWKPRQMKNNTKKADT